MIMNKDGIDVNREKDAGSRLASSYLHIHKTL